MIGGSSELAGFICHPYVEKVSNPQLTMNLGLLWSLVSVALETMHLLPAALGTHPVIRDIRFIPETVVNGVAYLKAGDEFKLTCDADGDPAPATQWYKDDVPIPEGQGSLEGCIQTWFDAASGVLTLRPQGCDRVRYNTALSGEFQCRAANELGTALSNVTRLEIAHINLRQEAENHKSQIVREGGAVKMVCAEIESAPEAEYSHNWEFRQSPDAGWQSVQRPSDEVWEVGNTLILLSVSPEDAGQYRCKGRNKVTGVTIRVEHSLWNLTVENSGIPVEGATQVIEDLLTSEPSDVYAEKDGFAALKCFAFGHPEVEMAWSVAPGERCPGDGDPSLDFRRIQEEDGRLLKNGRLLVLENLQQRHQGCYRCEARGVQGKYVKTMYVGVTEPPTVSITHPRDESRQFRCDVSGQSHPGIRWFLNDTEFSAAKHEHWAIIDEGRTLSITNPSSRATGVLSCRADWDQTTVIASVPLRLIPEAEEATVTKETDVSDQRMPNSMDPVPAHQTKSQLSLEQGKPQLTTPTTSGGVSQLNVIIISTVSVVIGSAITVVISLVVRRCSRRNHKSERNHRRSIYRPRHHVLRRVEEGDCEVSL